MLRFCCRGKVESSADEQSRKFRFRAATKTTHDILIWSKPGSRLTWTPKADATGLAPEKSAETLCEQLHWLAEGLRFWC